MPDLPRPPVTLRVSRPYGTEDEFIARDAPWFGRATLTLPHVAPRPVGELIRFEIVLATGAPVIRGEGPVVAHHPEGGSNPAGLEVRFARIDARSKLVLDRVRAVRAEHSPSTSRCPPAGWPSLIPGPLPSLTPPPPLRNVASPTAAPAIPGDRASEHSGVHMSRASRPVPAPSNRDEILARLRERAQRLAEQGVVPFRKRETG